MQIVIEVDRRLLVRAGLACALGAFVLGLAPSGLFAGPLTVPNSFTGGTTISASQMNDNFAAIEAEVDDNDARIAALEALLAGVTRDTSGTVDAIVFAGVNVQIHNGSGSTETANEAGNLILGYNENPGSAPRTGSHNLVIGQEHGYTGTAGIAAGWTHTIASNAYCIGGESNIASDDTVIVGGFQNETQSAARNSFGSPESFASVIVGGVGNRLNGQRSVIVGGQNGFIDFDAVETVGTGFDGNQVTLVGANGEGESDDGALNAGGGAPIVDIGINGGEVYVGDTANYVDVGFAAPTLSLGFQAGNAFMGGQAGQVEIGTAVSGRVAVGESANAVEVGNWAVDNVTVAYQAGRDKATGTANGGFGGVNVGNEATGFVTIANDVDDSIVVAQNATGTVLFGEGSPDVTYFKGLLSGRYSGRYDYPADGTFDGFQLDVEVRNGSLTTIHFAGNTWLTGTLDTATGNFSGFWEAGSLGGGTIPVSGTFRDDFSAFTLSGTDGSGNTATIEMFLQYR